MLLLFYLSRPVHNSFIVCCYTLYSTMKKYFQITIVLGTFFLLVVYRNFRGSDEISPVVGNGVPTTPTPTSGMPAQATVPVVQKGKYKDGTYTGSAEDAYYGNIQVQVTITNGSITDVQFLQYPNDNGTSRSINMQAMPYLRSEAIQAQSAQVDIVSGASDSSAAFIKSLGNALGQAS